MSNNGKGTAAEIRDEIDALEKRLAEQEQQVIETQMRTASLAVSQRESWRRLGELKERQKLLTWERLKRPGRRPVSSPL